MTAPIHTVKHVQNTYRKYQISVAIFALVTIAATFLAAVSGVRVALLQKQMTAEQASKASATAAMQGSQAKQIETLRQQLTTEKGRTQKLLQKLATLESQIAALKKSSKLVKPSQAEQPSTVSQPGTQPSPAEAAPAASPNPAATPTAEPAEKPAEPPVESSSAPAVQSTPQAPTEPEQPTQPPAAAPQEVPTPAPAETQPPDSSTPPAPPSPQSSGQQQPVEKGAATE